LLILVERIRANGLQRVLDGDESVQAHPIHAAGAGDGRDIAVHQPNLLEDNLVGDDTRLECPACPVYVVSKLMGANWEKMGPSS